MSQILAFAGSNSSRSINYQLVAYTVSLILDREVELLGMAQLDLPSFTHTFSVTEGILDAERAAAHKAALELFLSKL